MAVGQFGGTGDGSRNLNNSNVLPRPVPLVDPFAQAMSQNRTGGYGNTYTNDILDSLQPEGVNPNQYQNLAKPGTAPPPVAPPPSTGPGYDTGKYGPTGKPYPGMGLGTVLNPGHFLTGQGGGFYTAGPKDDRYVQPIGNGIPFGGGGQVFYDMASKMGLGPQGQPGAIPAGHIDPRTGKLVKPGDPQAQAPNALMHPQAQGQGQNHPLGMQPWQTQQAMALGYHPMLQQPAPHPAAHIQNMKTGVLHPNIMQDLLHGHTASLYGGGGGGY